MMVSGVGGAKVERVRGEDDGEKVRMNNVVRYGDKDSNVEGQVNELLGRMNLDEKIGQLVQIVPVDMAAITGEMQHTQEMGQPFGFGADLTLRADVLQLVRAGKVGSVFNLPDPKLVNSLQRAAVEESRLGIPLIVGADVIHGFRTVFPIPLAAACSWNPGLLEQAARLAAGEASACGVDWTFAPMLDVSRDPRWGRIAEGAGEDPFLAGELGRAQVRGFQATGLESGRRVAACPKHYVAYGAAEAGRDYNTVDISERTLRDIYLPPFKAAFEAGAGSVMSSFNEVAGVPATCNAFVLNTVLRDEWQWDGVVVSDYEALRELIPHGVAADLKEATRLSILAGLDMDMVSNGFAEHLATLVEEGAVPQQAVDEAVRRVLRLKLRLGLFERWELDEGLGEQVMLRAEARDPRDLALELAHQSMVLLKNDGNLLPLTPGAGHVAVIGPLADNRRDMLGCWSIFGRPDDVETVLDGVSAYLQGERAPTFVEGCRVSGDRPLDLDAAVAAAEQADVVVLVIGESADMSGEARSRVHLGLPGRQQELVDAMAATGKPIVTVLMSGRPLVIPQLARQSRALLVAWHGGIRAGRAVADVLFGRVNPSGKLTASWPRAEGQIPVYYAQKSTGRPIGGEGARQFDEPYKSTYIDEPNAPLFPFGFGLSYATFAYRDLVVENRELGQDDRLAVTVAVRNTGARAGDEIVQLYVRDLVGSVTRPVKELKGFQRITLQPGEEQRVRFELPVSELSFWNAQMQSVVEPGAFKVWVGPNSVEGLSGDFAVLTHFVASETHAHEASSANAGHQYVAGLPS
jgi:beta-glucosidase